MTKQGNFQRNYLLHKMAQYEENRLPMIVHHVVTRLQDSTVLFGGMLMQQRRYNGQIIHDWKPENYNKRTIWMYDLHIDLWRKFVIPEHAEAPPFSLGSTAVTIKTDIYLFATRKDTLGTVWQLKRDLNGCFSWREVPVKKAPSYRHDMAGWEYAEKMWIFGGCGPSPAGGGIRTGCYDTDGVAHNINNQLLCLDPSCGEWTIVKYAGAVPPPQCDCTSAIIRNEVWLYGGDGYGPSADLYNLDMNQLFWTHIHCELPSVLYRATLVFTGSKLVLHGDGLSMHLGDPSRDRRVLDLSSMSWRECKKEQHLNAFKYKCISGLNSCVLIGGYNAGWQD